VSRVLVIDDEPDICDVLSRILSRNGYDVVSAPDGSVGLRVCREQGPAVVITDVIMPGPHGVEVIRTLREEFPEIGIIAISGGGNAAQLGYEPGTIKTAAYLAAAGDAGADYCLTKPFEQADLLDCVKALAGRVGEVQH
jgi:CheY-like chemotaxis protein